MKKFSYLLVLFTLVLTQAQGTVVTMPKYCGGLYGDFTWLYMKSFPTDGDLQTGTFLTLTDDPSNLHAVLQQLEPDFRSAYRGNIGYCLPCSNIDLNVNYFHFNPTDSGSKVAIFDLPESEQFFQNFLGESWTNFRGSAFQKTNQINLTAGKRFIINSCLDLHPYIGVSYADISRKLHVNYQTLVPDLDPFTLNGTEKSDFCGAGPMIGMDFSYPIYRCLYLDGTFEGGVLFGSVKSKVDSTKTDEIGNVTDSYSHKVDYCRASSFLRSQIALA